MPITIPILIVLAFILSIYSIKFKKVSVAIAGAIFSFPVVYYLSGTPVFSNTIILVPIFQGFSAYFIHQKKIKFAWLMLIPLFLLITWIVKIYFI